MAVRGVAQIELTVVFGLDFSLPRTVGVLMMVSGM